MTQLQIGDYLHQQTGVRFPAIYPEIISRFITRYGSLDAGLQKFLDDLAFAYLGEVEEYFGYDGVPFEAEMVLYTGGDGECSGWVNLCPEVPDYTPPFVTFIPIGMGIEFHAQDNRTALSIQLASDDDFDWRQELDLDLFKASGVQPHKSGGDFAVIEAELSSPQLLPITIPEGYHYYPSADGVGVCAPRSVFAERTKTSFEPREDLTALLTQAEDYFKRNYFGSALLVCKAAWRSALFDNTTLTDRRNTLTLMETIYRSLNRARTADFVRRYRG